MSIFTRVSNHFNFMDSAYSDLYEKEVAFEEKPSDYNRKELQKSIDIFSKKLGLFSKKPKSFTKKNYLNDIILSSEESGYFTPVK